MMLRVPDVAIGINSGNSRKYGPGGKEPLSFRTRATYDADCPGQNH
jgi:hypothetical protein